MFRMPHHQILKLLQIEIPFVLWIIFFEEIVDNDGELLLHFVGGQIHLKHYSIQLQPFYI
jgi:hypothetical protein